MTEPATPPTDEYDTFRQLAAKLVAVPKKEVDQQVAETKDEKKKRRSR
jgi:hypothetical protein